MEVFEQIEAVYRRALLLRQYAVESPVQPDLLEKALQELYFVLEELQTAQEELHEQNQTLMATRQAVERERQRYQTLFDLAPTGYVVTDQKGIIQQANRYAAVSLFATPLEYLINKPLLVFVQESDRPYFQAQLTNSYLTQPWEVTLISPRKTLITVALRVTRIKDAPSRHDLLLWSLHEITSRNPLAQQLQNAAQEFVKPMTQPPTPLISPPLLLPPETANLHPTDPQIHEPTALIDITHDAIFVQDLNQHILSWSKGAERLYGWTAADMVAQSASLLFTPDALGHQATSLLFTLEQGAWQGELEQVTHAGQLMIVASRWMLVSNDTGQPPAILVVNTDITEQKQLENQLYQAQRIASLGFLTGGIAHDLNNVFTPILGMAQLRLQQSELDATNLEAWQVVQHSAQEGVDLVNQITWFTQGPAGQRTKLQVRDFLANITLILQRTFPSSITIQANLPVQSIGLLSADPTQLYQMVMNLCINAREAMRQGGTLTLSMAQCGLEAIPTRSHLAVSAERYIVITIADTGIGILPALRERIFEPFFTTKQPGQGKGLGLSSVVRIVKSHNGLIELSSQYGQGTQFQVYLPISEELTNSASDLAPVCS